MPSEAIPQTDKALLEAQAKAGPAGVQAYEVARKELAAQQQQTLAQATQAANARGGPASASQHAFTQASDIYQSRLDSLTQAQAAAERQDASRRTRMADYNQAVLGSRDLIEAQAQAAAEPIRLRGELEVNRLRQQGESAVDQIQANQSLSEAQFEMEMRRAAAAAQLEQDRWEREMAQRERLAAQAAASAAGGATGEKLSETELANVLRRAGRERIGQVVQAVGQEMTSGEIANALAQYASDYASSPYEARDAAITIYEQLHPKPTSDQFYQGGYSAEKAKAFNEALNEWRANANRWRDEGPSPSDFEDAIHYPGAPWSGLPGPEMEAVQKLIQEEKDRANAARKAAETGLAQYGLESAAPVQARGRDWLYAITSDLRAMDPGIADFLDIGLASGLRLSDPTRFATAMGTQLPDAYQYQQLPSEFVDRSFEAQNRYNEMQAGRWGQSELPQQGIAELALQRAMEQAVYGGGLDAFDVGQGDVLSALEKQQGLSYMDLVGPGTEQGYAARLADLLQSTDQQFEDAETSYNNAVDQQREDIRWQNYLTDQQYQQFQREVVNGPKNMQAQLYSDFLAQLAQDDPDAYNNLMSAGLGELGGYINSGDSQTYATPDQARTAWTNMTLDPDYSKYGFTSPIEAYNWLTSEPELDAMPMLQAKNAIPNLDSNASIIADAQRAISGAVTKEQAISILNDLGIRKGGQGTDRIFDLVMSRWTAAGESAPYYVDMPQLSD